MSTQLSPKFSRRASRRSTLAAACLGLVGLFAVATHAQTTPPATPPATPATQPAAEASPPSPAPATPAPAVAKPTDYHFLIVSIDGGRPDLLLRAETPRLHALLKSSAYTFWARTTAQSITLPSHTSMLTGVQPNVHQIFWNEDLPFSKPVYPRRPTLFELAKNAGYSTALVAGKSKFDTLLKPGTVDFHWITDSSTTGDAAVAENATRILESDKPDVLFVHFPGPDNAGHRYGWGSDEQIKSIEAVDGLLGKLLDTLDRTGRTASTYVLISADHGGAGLAHGPDDPRSRHIPWILRGPNVRPNYDLTRVRPLEVKTEDTFATACYLLKIPLIREVEGQPVLPAFQNLDLLKSSDAK